MRAIIAAARDYHVDSFEVCGEAHSALGNLDGAIRFRDYPAAAAQIDLAAREANIRTLREIARLAHDSGRPMLYWHREVMVPRALVETIPGLLDENGEFDLLGEIYHALLRAKIREFFENVPEMDGLVLTVTESDYSVIHNSRPDRYPPALVVKKVVTTFAEELKRHGKRFVLRSFGSIAQDYDDIFAGAREVEASFSFEVETKITPYDFSPFLPLNPYLGETGHFTRSAEYDSLGEFLGAGFLPAADPARVIECVRYARGLGVARHTIRVDRIGHATFASTQAINLLAFDRAIRDPEVTAEAIWAEWAARRWPGCAGEMTALMQRGIELVKKTHFIDGHVIFHAFPIDPTWKWPQACGILSVFRPGITLAHHQGMWGILPEKTTPARAALLAEKDDAVRIADESWQRLAELASRLPEKEYEFARVAWSNAVIVTRLIRAWCRCVCAYFDDLDARDPAHPALTHAIAEARAEFARVSPAALAAAELSGQEQTAKAQGHEYGDSRDVEDSLDRAYARPLWQLIRLLVPYYEAEFAERRVWEAQPGLIEAVACGGLADDWRVVRYMHASHARLDNGRVARAAGNRVFPNGFLECTLAVPPSGEGRLVIKTDPAKAAGFRLTVDGEARDVACDPDGVYEVRVKAAAGSKVVKIRIQKSGATYPVVYGMGTVA